MEALRKHCGFESNRPSGTGLLGDPLYQGGIPEVGWSGEGFCFLFPPLGSQEGVSTVKHLSELDLCPLLLGDMLDG